MKRINIRDLRSVEGTQPGFVKEMLDIGEREGETLLIEEKKYAELHKKFYGECAHLLGSVQVAAAVVDGKVIPTSEHGRAPGAMLSMLIYQLTGVQSSDCAACSERAGQMNEWGWFGCWENRATISQWLIDEGKKRGVAVSENKILRLLQKIFILR